MRKWNQRLKKIEKKAFKMNKEEMLNKWIENQELPSDWTYRTIHSQLPNHLKGECMKKVLVELFKKE